MSKEPVKTVNPEIVIPEGTGRPEGSYTYDLTSPDMIRVIHNLAKRGLAKTEIAARLGISYRQFTRRCNSQEELNAAILAGWGQLLEDLENQELKLAKKGNVFLLPRVIDRLRAIIDRDEEREMRDVEARDAGQEGRGAVTRDELIAAIKKDPFMQIEGVTDDDGGETDSSSGESSGSSESGQKKTKKRAKKKTGKKATSKKARGDKDSGQSD